MGTVLTPINSYFRKCTGKIEDRYIMIDTYIFIWKIKFCDLANSYFCKCTEKIEDRYIMIDTYIFIWKIKFCDLALSCIE